MATVELNLTPRTGQPISGRLNYQGSFTAGDDYTFPNDGKTYLILRKANAGNSTLTFTSTKVVSGLAVADPTVQVNRNQARFVGPFPVDLYGTTVAISGITNESQLSIAVVRLP